MMSLFFRNISNVLSRADSSSFVRVSFFWMSDNTEEMLTAILKKWKVLFVKKGVIFRNEGRRIRRRKYFRY